jgi:hypothetical protein
VVTDISEETTSSNFRVEVSLQMQALCFSGSLVPTQQSLGDRKVEDQNILINSLSNDENIITCKEIQIICQLVVFCSMVLFYGAVLWYCSMVLFYGTLLSASGCAPPYWRVALAYSYAHCRVRRSFSCPESYFLSDTDLDTKGFVENDTYLK